MFLRIFGLTWVIYCGFYLCRKNFSVLMPFLKAEQGYTSESLAHVLFLYSLAYAIGQFTMGQLSDRFGARLVVSVGAIGSSIASALAATGFPLVLSQGANGFLQAAGWPGVLKMARDWFPTANRGVVMAWWGTHLVVGGFLASNLAAFAATGGWRQAAWMPAAILTSLALLFFSFSRDGAGPAPRKQYKHRVPLPFTSRLIAIAAMYFCVKLTRYSFLFWLPLYLTERLAYSPVNAGYASSIYDGMGFAGVLFAGYVSEKFWGGKRFPIGALMMLGLAVLCIGYPLLSSLGTQANLAAIALIGGFTFGPDTIMAGSGTQESVPREAVGRAGGFVNGVGSIGQVLSPYFVAGISTHFGWNALFYSLGLAALLGAAALATQWKKS